jgi:hypothetical protein
MLFDEYVQRATASTTRVTNSTFLRYLVRNLMKLLTIFLFYSSDLLVILGLSTDL